MFGVLRFWLWTDGLGGGPGGGGDGESPHNDYQVFVIDNMPAVILPNE
mgnify:CR=1 FL=1